MVENSLTGRAGGSSIVHEALARGGEIALSPERRDELSRVAKERARGGTMGFPRASAC